jgi:RND family efflux transporter MFP subunit
MQQEVQRTTVQPATVHAFYKAKIRAKVSGYVQELRVDIGDHVQAGDPLLVIDVPELVKQRQIMDAKVRRAEAEEARAEAGILLATANVRAASARLDQAKSEMNRVEASLAAAEAEFERTSDLVQRQSLERRMLDEVRKKRDTELAAKQSVESAIVSAEADVTVAEAKLTSAKADLDAAKSDSKIAQGQLEEVEVLLDYTTLKAPFTGVITSRDVDPGDLVLAESDSTKGPSLLTVSQVDKVRIQTPVPEADAALVNPGDVMSLSFPSFPDEAPLEATVSRRSGSLDPQTRTMLVEAEVDNPDMKLLPGMFGQATIKIGKALASNVLPARAVRFDTEGNAFVYAVGEQETIEIVPVTTGIDDGTTIEIRSGIEAGQQVVDAHLRRLASGQKVMVLTRSPR